MTLLLLAALPYEMGSRHFHDARIIVYQHPDGTRTFYRPTYLRTTMSPAAYVRLEEILAHTLCIPIVVSMFRTLPRTINQVGRKPKDPHHMTIADAEARAADPAPLVFHVRRDFHPRVIDPVYLQLIVSVRSLVSHAEYVVPDHPPNTPHAPTTIDAFAAATIATPFPLIPVTKARYMAFRRGTVPDAPRSLYATPGSALQRKYAPHTRAKAPRTPPDDRETPPRAPVFAQCRTTDLARDRT